MARKSSGDKKLKAIIDSINGDIEHREKAISARENENQRDQEIVNILKAQVKKIKEICKKYDEDIKNRPNNKGGNENTNGKDA